MSDSDKVRLLDSFTAPKELLNEFADEDADDEISARIKAKKITSHQNSYHERRFDRAADVRADPFAEGAAEGEATSYADVMKRAELEREEIRVQREIQRKIEAGEYANGTTIANGSKGHSPRQIEAGTPTRDDGDKTPTRETWADSDDEASGGEQEKPAPRKRSESAETAAAVEPPAKKRKSRWDQSEPATEPAAEPPRPARKSRWDQTAPTETAVATTTENGSGPLFGAIAAPIDPRNRFLTDEELNYLLPSEGYEIVPPPADYVPVRSAAQKVAAQAAAAAAAAPGGFTMPETGVTAEMLGITQELPTDIPGVGDLAFFKEEDATYFATVLEETDDDALTVAELKERKILRLLLRIKNGTPPMRKTAMRQITERAREFGPGPLFDKILPLLMERNLQDQERHLLVKVVDRVLYKLDDLVRPYVHKILVVIEPLLIDEDLYARVEGREIIANLAKAAGLAHMIATMRPDIDHADDYVRNTTACAFAVVASALGIPALLPFLRAVCRSKKSWQARHTGLKIVQQTAIMMGCAVLPHLAGLVGAVAAALEDEHQKVRTMAALSLAALAEAAAPYGIEAFDSVLRPLWVGIRRHRGKALAAFLRAIGCVIPLMDAEYANYYTREVMVVLLREFATPDDDMRRIVLRVVQQCVATDGVEPAYVRAEVLPAFCTHFLVRRVALDRRSARAVVATALALAHSVGAGAMAARLADALRDESEPFRALVVEILTRVVGDLGASDIDGGLETRLIDGLVFAFQEQTTEDRILLEGVATVVDALGTRVRPYLTQIVSMVLWRLNNKSATVRMQAADLTARLAAAVRACDEDALLAKLGVVLFEQLGEEYPDTLGSIIGALGAIANVVGMAQMNPPVKDLLPRMTPILRNRHEKVQEASINLIGRIADRGAEFVSAREWMRICFELLDLLKAHKRAIRRASVNSFGYIAKAIGPQDVLSVLLTNLRVQDRQSRVCSTIAIAIVAETCGPFTCIPAILNEYRTPELNVRNGCLKAMSFLFEYIGEMGKDYIYSVLTCLEDALTDRDLVHRQTSASIVKHLALGTAGLGVEDAHMHLLNLLWPNIFETSPHVINAVLEAVEAMRVALGPGILLDFVLPGLWHPARRVREVYWNIYNTLYMGAQDALVAYYPVMDDLSDDRNVYERDVLSVWI